MAARKLPGQACWVEGRTVAGSGLAYLAVACPVCNKIVISLIGDSGRSPTSFRSNRCWGGSAGLMLFALRRALRAASPPVAMLPQLLHADHDLFVTDTFLFGGDGGMAREDPTTHYSVDEST